MRRQALTVLLPKSIAPKYIPIFGYVAAGNPNIHREVFEGKTNLHQLIIPSPTTTYIIKVKDVFLSDFGIFENDYVIIDAAISPEAKDIVLASWEAANILTTFEYAQSRNLEIQGVVNFILHFKKPISYFESSNRSSVAGDDFDRWLNTGIDLNQLLIKHPKHTMVLAVTGDSMIEDNIDDGDLVVVEKGTVPENKEIIVARVNDGYTLKRFQKNTSFEAKLLPANKRYDPIRINYFSNFIYYGKVTAVIKPRKGINFSE